ncbi:MAG: phytase, partial [Alphaproteobacteria bacterium]|nr:phytase [Alphaproteobacteria bacterium]
SIDGLIPANPAGDGTPVDVDEDVPKRQLADLSELGITLDKFEGMTFGPDLADGRKTLILVSDNDFNETQATRFVALALDIDSIPAVPPTVETPGLVRFGDPENPDPDLEIDPDDPAIYVHPTDADDSFFIGTEKNTGLRVYDLDGEILQEIAPDGIRYNNVELIYGFDLDGEEVDLAVVTDRANDTLVVFEIDPETRTLTDITADDLSDPDFSIFGVDDGEQTAYGLATYTSLLDGSQFAYVTQADGAQFAQLELSDNGGGTVTAEVVRTIDLPTPTGDPADSQAEGLVVDRERGIGYIAMEEEEGLFRFDPEADGSDALELIASIADSDFLDADLEGMTIYYGDEGAGYIILSSQGDNTFAVFDRDPATGNAYLGSFGISDSADGIDGTEETDSIDVINVPLPGFPSGVFAVQDGSNEPAVVFQDPEDGEVQNFNVNFKLVPWENIAEAFDPPLIIDTESFDPRAVTPVGRTPIPTIQGEGHSSPLLGQVVTTEGIVTAVDSNGFHIQDPAGDGNIATSDALFVFLNDAPAVAVGDSVSVTGEVSEFIPGGSGTGNLSTTQIAFPDDVTVLSSGNDLPEPVILGRDGRVPPDRVIDDDAFGTIDGLGDFDPEADGIDFFESLEAMRVTANDAVAVSGTNRFGEIFAVVDGGVDASGISDRGTLNIAPDDFNPEKVQIDEDSGIFSFDFPEVDVGALLGDVTGVIGYGFGNFEILVTEDFTANIVPSDLQPETTTLDISEPRLTVASYNVLNLDPVVEDVANVDDMDEGDVDDDAGDGRFDAIAAQIVDSLNAPDIIALQEIQDNDGAEISDVTAADLTLQTLAEAIAAAGGPAYAFIDTPGVPTTFVDADGNLVRPVGGQPGGDIRNAFLYNPERVDLVEGSVRTILDDNDDLFPFFEGRIPLEATFSFGGEQVTIINNHLSSKSGSAPILGMEQPFDERQEEPEVNGSLDQRREQAEAVNDRVAEILGTDPEAHIVVAGDLNEFEFISPVDDILAENLANLTDQLPGDERYTFIFQGNSQSLDHVLVSEALDGDARLDILHVNAEFAETPSRASDHEPLLALLDLRPLDLAVVDLFDADFYLAENPDVAQAGVDPRTHYAQSGFLEGRDPNPVFDTDLYLALNADVAVAGINPLTHYEQFGAEEGRNPNPTFDVGFYFDTNPDVRFDRLEPLNHYLTAGAEAGADPNPFFDTDFYLAQNPDVAAAGVNPLVHYNQSGFLEGRDPGPDFSTQGYLAANPDVAEAGFNPLSHFLAFGQEEGRMAIGVDDFMG